MNKQSHIMNVDINLIHEIQFSGRLQQVLLSPSGNFLAIMAASNDFGQSKCLVYRRCASGKFIIHAEQVMIYDVSEQEDDLAMCLGRCCWLNDSHLILVRPFRKVAIWNVENNFIQRVPVRSGALPSLSIARNRQHIAISWYAEYLSKSLHATFKLFSLKKVCSQTNRHLFVPIRARTACAMMTKTTRFSLLSTRLLM